MILHNLIFFFIILCLFYCLLYYLHTQPGMAAYVLSGIISLPFLYGALYYSSKEKVALYFLLSLVTALVLKLSDRTRFQGYELLFLLFILTFIQSYFTGISVNPLLYLAVLWTLLCLMDYLSGSYKKEALLSRCSDYYILALVLSAYYTLVLPLLRMDWIKNAFFLSASSILCIAIFIVLTALLLLAKHFLPRYFMRCNLLSLHTASIGYGLWGLTSLMLLILSAFTVWNT